MRWVLFFWYKRGNITVLAVDRHFRETLSGLCGGLSYDIK